MTSLADPASTAAWFTETATESHSPPSDETFTHELGFSFDHFKVTL